MGGGEQDTALRDEQDTHNLIGGKQDPHNPIALRDTPGAYLAVLVVSFEPQRPVYPKP